MVYLLKNHKIIFIFNAKCASTTIKNVICQIDNISTDENNLKLIRCSKFLDYEAAARLGAGEFPKVSLLFQKV